MKLRRHLPQRPVLEDDLVLHLPERLVQIRRHRLRGGTRTVNADLVAGCDALHLGRYASRGAQPRRSTGKRQKNYAVRASASRSRSHCTTSAAPPYALPIFAAYRTRAGAGSLLYVEGNHKNRGKRAVARLGGNAPSDGGQCNRRTRRS